MIQRFLSRPISLSRATSCLAFMVICATGVPSVQANVAVSLAEPNWQFLLDSRPVELSSAKLEASERRFAQRLKPLLNAKQYNGVAELFAQRDINHDSAALRQLRGQVYLSLKRLDEAEAALRAAIDLMPNLALAHRSLSMLYMLKKDYDKATVHLTRSIALGVADAQLYGQLAFINLNNHHAASAINGYQQALYLQPENTQWQQGLLYAWLNSHNFSAAKRLVEDMLEQQRHDNPTELWLLRSQIALQMQQPQQALASIEVALHLVESLPEPPITKAQLTQNKVLAAKLHVQQGSVQRAVALLTSSLAGLAELHGEQAAEVKNEVITALDQVLPWLFNKGEGRKAANLLSVAETVEMPPLFNAKMNMYRGQLALQQDKIPQAIKRLRQAVQQDPSLGEALLSLAKAYRQQGEFQQAQRYFVRASALPEARLRALLANAQLHIDQQFYSQALDLLLKALELVPHRQDIRHNVSALQTLINQGQYES